MRIVRFPLLLPAICMAGFAVWTLPYLRFGLFGYGYDTGLYRRFLIQPFVSFPNTPVPGLDHTVFIPRLLLDVFRFVHSPDVILFGVYLLLGIAGIVSVYF